MRTRGHGARAAALLMGAIGMLLASPGGATAMQKELSLVNELFGSDVEQTKDQQKCTNALNKDLAKLTATASKNIQACVKDFQKGKTANLGPDGTAEGCLTADVKGKLAKARAKLLKDWDKKCTGSDKNGVPLLPGWGVSDPNTIDDAALQKELFLVRDVFGSDLDFNLSLDKDPSKCQQAVFKDTLKCQDAILKEFNKCKKDGLKGKSGPAFASAGDLEGCWGQDPKGKIAKACDDPAKPDKIRKDIEKKCVGKAVNLSEAFPGCDTDDAAELHECLSKAAECRACYAVRRADDLEQTCAACIPQGAIGSLTCRFDQRSWCVGGPRDGEPCVEEITDADCIEPGNRGNCLSLSHAIVHTRTGSPLFDLPNGAEWTFLVGAPDPVTGITSFETQLNFAQPLDFGPLIGVACLTRFAVPGCNPVGQIDCDGGLPLERDHQNFHNIGDCGLGDDPNETDPNNNAGPSECRTLCEARCASLPGSFTVFRTGCEGYCRFGQRNDLRCSNDIECFGDDGMGGVDLDGSGECVGGEPVAHGNRCQCECEGLGGAPSRPGDWTSNEGLRTIVESSQPCDGLDPTLISPACADRGTTNQQASIFDADAMIGAVISASETGWGWPVSCWQLARGNVGTLRVQGNTPTQDGGLGDQVSTTGIQCRGPGYGIAP